MSSIFTLEKIFKAYNDCKAGKGRTANAILFELNREKNLVSLLEELISRKYIPSRHICFVATVPVPREIFAADFRDRVVHHFFYNELHEFCDKSFIRHSYANRLNKGTHSAVRTVKEFVRHNPNGYCLKLDVRSFFPSINRNILSRLVEQNIYQCAENYEKSRAGGGH
jgi:retron-type reverse transcriptase